MPWFPDFANAVELARRQSRVAGRDDPVGRYFAALGQGDTDALESVWPGEVVVYDPRAGEIRGHHRLRRFVRRNQAWLGEHRARVETVAGTSVAGRAVVELVAHLTGFPVWPVAVVAESHDDRSVEFRTYCSQLPFGRHEIRPPILERGAEPDGIAGRYQAALAAGDVDAAVRAFEPTGYLREPIGPDATHTGAAELHSYFTACFGAGGGIELQSCRVTDDGARCAVEYNCVRWGRHHIQPQAGVRVYERGPNGLLAAVRVYDDIAPPTA